MTDGPKYAQLNELGKCIVDKQVAKLPEGIRQLPDIRDIVAPRIDNIIIARGGSRTSLSVTTKDQTGKMNDTTVYKEETYKYSDEVSSCIGQLNPKLPLTAESVRQKTIPTK